MQGVAYGRNKKERKVGNGIIIIFKNKIIYKSFEDDKKNMVG